MHWEIRVTRRKPDYLNPSLQKMQSSIRRKDSLTGASPCVGRISGVRNPPGRSDSSQEFKEMKGTPKSRLVRTGVANMGSPKGRESYGNGGP